MPSAGQLLRSERVKRNRSLADIAAETCISARYLEAIEADDIKQLPGDFFYKAFLRQYAKALDLDPPTAERVMSAAIPTEEPDPVPALSEAYANASVGASSRWAPPTAVAVGALVAVIAAGSALYAWWQRSESQKENASIETSVKAASQPAAQPQHTTPEVPKPQEPAPQQQPATPQPAAPAVTGTGNIALELAASEPTWVQLSSAGKTVYIGILQPNDPRQFAVTENAKLVTGNAGGLDVRMNGKPLGALGPKGQVRSVYFTSDAFQITGPKPKVPASPEGTPNAASVAIRPTSVDH